MILYLIIQENQIVLLMLEVKEYEKKTQRLCDKISDVRDVEYIEVGISEVNNNNNKHICTLRGRISSTSSSAHILQSRSSATTPSNINSSKINRAQPEYKFSTVTLVAAELYAHRRTSIS